MAIEIRQPGGAKGAAQAGQIIGTAQKIKREQEQAFQLAAEQRARQWDLEKMEMRSQQEFAHELRMRQAELDKESRAQEWDVEKMEIRSRMDFAESEKKRQEKMARGRTMLESINKAYDSGQFDRDNPPSELVAREAYARDLAESGETAPASLYPPKTVSTLTPKEQGIAERIKAGLLPRATTQSTTPLEAEVKVVQQLVGRDIANLQDLVQSREEGRAKAEELGLDYDALIAEELGKPVSEEVTINVNPIKVNSVEEARALPEGTEFITPDGRRMRR